MTKRSIDDKNDVVAPHLYFLEFGGQAQGKGGGAEEYHGEADDRNHSVPRFLHRSPRFLRLRGGFGLCRRDAWGFLECAFSSFAL